MKQNLLELHTTKGRKVISKIMNSKGQYIYVLNSSEPSYDLFDIEKSTFYSWNQIWDYFKRTTEGWNNCLPVLLHQDIRSIMKHELRESIYDFSIAQYQLWKREVLPLWESCMREEVLGTSEEEWLKRAS